jgi:hypothetical protein
MSKTDELTKRLKSNIPEEHRASADTRVQWLWNQRLIVVQSIYMRTDDILDKMAATLVIQAAWSGHLPSIELVLKRLEGGAIPDQAIVEEDSLVL